MRVSTCASVTRGHHTRRMLGRQTGVARLALMNVGIIGTVVGDGLQVLRELDRGVSSRVYLVSDGGTKPWRVRFRTPTFWNLQSISWMAQGHLVADLVAIIGTLDVVLGDCDR